VARFTATSVPIQFARSLLAAATLSVIAFTSWDALTPEVAGAGRPSYCKPPLNLGLLCLDASPDKSFARWIMAIVLILVILGLVPALTSMLHAWVAFSFSVGIGLPDGGEQVAQLVALLIFLMSLDNWAWCAWLPQRGRAFETGKWSQGTAGIRWAAWIGLRIQMAYIYLESAISKLSHEDWMNGSAMYYFVRDPSFGGSGAIGQFARWITSFDLGTALSTWFPIVMETSIALLIFGGRRRRTLGLGIAVVLHVGIIAVIGLWSFAIIMISAVALATLPHIEPARRPEITPDQSSKDVAGLKPAQSRSFSN